jgi:hypothetical protein
MLPSPAGAHLVGGEYSMEVTVGEASVAVGSKFIAYVGVTHSGGFQGAQWHIEYDQNVLDAGTLALDSAASAACDLSSTNDDGSRLVLACADTAGPNITYSGTYFRVQFTCIADGTASLTLETGVQPTFVRSGGVDQPLHLHHDDEVQCGAGDPPPPPPTPAPGQQSCTVQEVLTGDSFVCSDGTRVRMLQIDAQDLNQCGGGWARAALANIFLPVGRQIVLDFDEDRNDGGMTLAAPIARGTDGYDYNLSIVMVYVGLAKAATVGSGNVEYLDWANASQVWASVAQWNMWAPNKTYTGGCD